MIELNEENLFSDKGSCLDQRWNVSTYFSKTRQYKMSRKFVQGSQVVARGRSMEGQIWQTNGHSSAIFSCENSQSSLMQGGLSGWFQFSWLIHSLHNNAPSCAWFIQRGLIKWSWIGGRQGYQKKKTKQTPWPYSASELYRPSDRRFSAELVPTLADWGCRVVTVTNCHGR
jgi:hypothetical protein